MPSIKSPLPSLIKEIDALIAQTKIHSAQNLLSNLLNKEPTYLPAITRSFDLALQTHDFCSAKNHLEQLKLLDSSLYNNELRTIQFFEAKQDYFELIKVMQVHLKANKNLEMTFKLGLNAIKVGQIALAEQSFDICEEYKFDHPFLMLNFGHLHKAKGNSELAANYYNKFLTTYPQHCGTGYWSLADLKNYIFSFPEQEAIKKHIKSNNANIGNIALLSFALARCYEQQGEYKIAFSSMTNANNIIAKYRPFKAELYQQLVERLMTYKPKDSNYDQIDNNFTPIFIVGMPRSGSTLIEQILASHSKIEATDELPFIERIALELEQQGGVDKQLSIMTEEQRVIYAQQYKKEALKYISNRSKVIIDKNPNNFLHISLIIKLFPNAKIINIIRSPFDNTLSVFKQYFSQGHEYSYSLKGIIIYWQSYLKLMRFWTEAFEDNILNLGYESLTDSPEQETRNILAHCGLYFEKKCLLFYQSKRAVLTPSVNQVKQPINKNSVNSWKGYESEIEVHLDALNALSLDALKLIKRN